MGEKTAIRMQVGDSSFEGWYEGYHREGVSKQVARDAYAAGMSDPVARPAPDPQLCKFYGVETYRALVEAQARHIEKLQAKLPNTTGVFMTQKVREG